MHTIKVTYGELLAIAGQAEGLLPKVRHMSLGPKDVEVRLELGGALHVAVVHYDENAGSDWDHFHNTVKPQLDYGVTAEGWLKTANPPAGPQSIEYAQGSVAMELPTDADVTAFLAAGDRAAKLATLPRGCAWLEATGAAGDDSPVVSYHVYPIVADLSLNAVAAEWQNVPRFTQIEVDTGFYLDAADESTFCRMGGFTLANQGITLAGTNHQPIKMPPGGTWASANLYPQLPILMDGATPQMDGEGIPLVDHALGADLLAHLGAGTTIIANLIVRLKIKRTRPCELDANSAEIRPYIDVDWDMTRKK
jgi:hypothetical protein